MIHHNLIKSIAEQRAEELQRTAAQGPRRPAISAKPVIRSLSVRRRFARFAAVAGASR